MQAIPKIPTPPEKRSAPETRKRVMKRAIKEGGFFSLMTALGEAYFPAFALASGLGNIAAGLIATLPLLFGALFQFFAPRFLPFIGSHRKWVISFTALQGVTLIPIILYAFSGGITLVPLFVSAILYSIFGMMAGPVWSGWISELFPTKIHPHFFARRNRKIQINHMFGFVLGGVALHSIPVANINTVFGALFSIAFFFRFCSVYLLYKQPELSPDPAQSTIPPSLTWKRRINFNGRLTRLFAFLFLFQFGVGVASPFFTPYMLTQLKLTYLQYAILTLVCVLGKIIALPLSSRLYRLNGASPFFRWNGVLIATLPLLFLVCPDFYLLMLVQLVSGFAWAGFELVTVVHLLKLIPQKNRTQMITYYHFGNAMAVALSSMIGGLLLGKLGTNGFAVIFLLSFGIRILAQFIPLETKKPKLSLISVSSVSTEDTLNNL